MLQNKFKRLITLKIKKVIYNLTKDILDFYYIKSYSQEGEDVVLRRFLENRMNGFYIDIGAHHPKRFSNTYYFYKKGWRGINIDAMPGSMELFKNKRPRDINLEFAVSDKKDKLTYYAFNEPAINGFSDALSFERNKKDNYKIIFKKEIETKTLAEILDKYLPVENIDFMSIDVEGLDLNVLRSNNWDKYKPDFLIVEILNSEIEDIFKNDIFVFLKGRGYEPVAKTLHSVIFRIK